MMRALALFSAVELAAAHGSMSQPRSRNQHGLKIDGSDCDPAKFGNRNACTAACMGEACEWFNDGCVIGCDTCSNSGLNGNYGDFNCTTHGVRTADPPMPASVLPQNFRTWDIKGLGPNKVTTNHPWRAPGHSPITNPCGIASGTVPGLPGGGDGRGKPPAVPVGYPRAMNGTELPPLDGAPTPWKAGQTAEVAWAILANHGGGYSYRLCPKGTDPTEDCFQSHPLDFVGKTTTIRMDNNQSHPDFEIPATDTVTGTSPKGSMWRVNPIPACNCDLGEEGSCWGGDIKGWAGNSSGTKAYSLDPEAPKKTPRCPTGVQFPPAWPEGYGFSSIFHSPADEQDLISAQEQGKCSAVRKDQCGTQTGTNTCLKCGSGTEHECLECCPGTTKTTKKGYGTWCVPNKTPGKKPGKQSWFSLVDEVRVPEQKGEYLLSFRWDCEQTPQVWNTCADIVVV